jgi:hypothetical protein
MESRRARHRAARLVGLLFLLVACSTGESSPEPAADAGARASSPTTRTPTALPHGAFCREYEKKVRLVYTVVSRRAGSGKVLTIRLTVHNGSDRHLLGDIGGAMAVTGQRPGSSTRYEWGDSPDDVIGVRALTTRRVLMSNLGAKPLAVPADARVSLLGVWSRLGPSRTGREPCRLPADLRAPRGLVLGHPDGHWTLSARRGERLADRARR